MINGIIHIVEQVDDLPIKVKEEVNELLEYSEWGIALETLCAALLEEDLPIFRATFEEIKDAGEAMELDSLSWENIVVK